jgi:hypothetical protein
MAGKSANSFGAKNWAPNSPATRYNVSGKNREFYTFENAPGIGAYATGGTIIDGGDGYIYHIFTGDGTFTVNRPPAAINSVDYLVVAGGGAMPASNAPPRGGGGGGGFRFGNYGVSNAPGVYSIGVGAGGPSAPSGPPGTLRSGSDSYFDGLSGVVSAGGGGGGGPGNTGTPGGSGGGGPSAPAGTGNIPATIPRQGYPGGGASGGGAGGVGAPGGVTGPGRIDPNFPADIVGKAIPSPVYSTWYPLVSSGGYAAGGVGSPFPGPAERPAPDNSGYGGGGGFSGITTYAGGGSGIVCVRYKKNVTYSRATGGTIEPNTHPEHPGVWRHIFTSPGDFTVTDPTLQRIDYLAVGGGGGGGGGGTGTLGAGGGGGAGGFVSSIHTSTTTPTAIPEAYSWNPGYSVEVGEQYAVGIGTYPIGIGTGGTGGVGINTGNTGNNTTIGSPGVSQIIAYGGGGGAGGGVSNGSPGGSGGGASKGFPVPGTFSGGTATPSPFIQGNTGGPIGPLANGGSAGGGGAGDTGDAGTPGGTGTAGGSGWYSVLSPSSYGTPGPVSGQRYFAGGGGGGGGLSPGPTAKAGGAGGAGGGGAGSNMPTVPPSINPATSGTTNTGGGGGGARASTPSTGGNGGPGIVIIQYPE